MSLKPKRGRKPGPIWDHFEQDDLDNSKHFQAICSYCRDPILGVPERMLNDLKESYNVYKEVEIEIQNQIWKISDFSNQHHTGNIMFDAYKEVGMSLDNKLIGFVSDS
ncbi:15033_t:CDS:2, partial [Dentiscutata heterogama]